MTVDLTTLMQRHTTAMGGAKAVESMRAIEIRFTVAEPTFAAKGVYAADRVGRVRVDVYVDSVRVFSEGHNGDRAWQWPQGADHGEPASEAGALALIQGIDNQLLGLHELPDRGYQLRLEGVETIGNQDYHVIRIKTPLAGEIRRYVNPHTWRIERSRERKALHPDVDSTETNIETVFDRFERLENGVLRPRHETQIDLTTGEVLATTKVHNFNIRPVWASDHFDVP